MYKEPLKARLRRGRGALARNGEYWYPVRVIHLEKDGQWRVRWWRACNFSTPGIIPDTITTVSEDDVVDSLWNDKTGRRKIKVSEQYSRSKQKNNAAQLGKWTHSWDIPSSEDILSDPSSIPYNEFIHEALIPAQSILRQLLDAPYTVDSKEVPAKGWLEEMTKKSKKDISKEIVPYVGSLSLTVRAQISNWFDINISKDEKIRHKWIALLPIAHAHTVYITALLRANPQNMKLTDAELLNKAWDVQFSSTPSVLKDIDVDQDCLYILEEEMFERSIRAGGAGHYQWGLDAGDHHYWNPYGGIPQEWDHGDREGSESELEVSFCQVIPRQVDSHE